MIPELVTIHTSLLTDLGDAVRAKTGGSEEMTLADMATAVTNIPSGGSSDVLVPPIYPTPDVTITIT